MKNNFKLTNRTKQIIANFASINRSMLFKPGNELKTLSVHRDIMAVARIEESLPLQFGINDLSKLLSILSTYDDPSIAFADKQLTISSDNNKKYNFRYTDAGMILSPPDNAVDQLEVGDPIVKFELNAADLANLIKIVSISKHPEVCFEASDGELALMSADSKKLNPDNYTNVIGKCDTDFVLNFKLEKFNVLLPATYKVTLTKNICLFDCTDVSYYIAPEES